MEDIYQKIAEIRAKRIPSALVTVTEARGSTPRNAGAKMLVLADGTIYGTIGGAAVEALVIKEAQASIQSGEFRKVTHSLNDAEKHDTGMVCGGTMEFFIEPVNQVSHLYILGGGHCGYPLARIARQVGFQYTLVEDRPEFATEERFPDAEQILIGEMEQIARDLKTMDTDFIAIVTRNHELDYLSLKNILKKPAKYIGLIGSKAKRKKVFERLRDDGFSEADIGRIHTPIGIEIKAETPEEIAISILAQIILVKNS